MAKALGKNSAINVTIGLLLVACVAVWATANERATVYHRVSNLEHRCTVIETAIGRMPTLLDRLESVLKQAETKP